MNYQNPPIPIGFEAAGRGWNEGFTIRHKNTQNEYVWIPVLSLEKDGYLCRQVPRAYLGCRGLTQAYPESESVNADLDRQYRAVLRYGGFYLAKYSASRGRDGRICFQPGTVPLTHINKAGARKLARTHFEGLGVSCHLPYLAETDSALAWLLKTGALTEAEISAARCTRDMMSPDRNLRNNLGRDAVIDLVGNVDEWLQESNDEGSARCGTCNFPSTSHCYFRPYSCYTFTGFRTALTILATED